MKLLAMILCVGLLAGCGEKEPEADKNGKKPADYVKPYYTALEKLDIKALKKLYSKGYYRHITYVRHRDAIIDSEFEDKVKRDAEDLKDYKKHEIDPERGGYYKNNAEGVYAVGIKAFYTDEAIAENEKVLGYRSKVILTNLLFRLEEGVWRITHHEGY
ncbi:MAG: hypothetical protein ACYTGH_14415 [Planctomycetota bacterium]|jgi:hypothetical protein